MEEVAIVCIRDDYVVGRVSKARVNQAILDDKNRIVGRVSSVFGPVERPYIKIRIQRKWGRRLYLGGEKRWEKKKKRRKRRSG